MFRGYRHPGTSSHSRDDANMYREQSIATTQQSDTSLYVFKPTYLDQTTIAPTTESEGLSDNAEVTHPFNNTGICFATVSVTSDYYKHPETLKFIINTLIKKFTTINSTVSQQTEHQIFFINNAFIQYLTEMVRKKTLTEDEAKQIARTKGTKWKFTFDEAIQSINQERGSASPPLPPIAPQVIDWEKIFDIPIYRHLDLLVECLFNKDTSRAFYARYALEQQAKATLEILPDSAERSKITRLYTLALKELPEKLLDNEQQRIIYQNIQSQLDSLYTKSVIPKPETETDDATQDSDLTTTSGDLTDLLHTVKIDSEQLAKDFYNRVNSNPKIRDNYTRSTMLRIAEHAFNLCFANKDNIAKLETDYLKSLHRDIRDQYYSMLQEDKENLLKKYARQYLFTSNKTSKNLSTHIWRFFSKYSSTLEEYLRLLDLIQKYLRLELKGFLLTGTFSNVNQINETFGLSGSGIILTPTSDKNSQQNLPIKAHIPYPITSDTTGASASTFAMTIETTNWLENQPTILMQLQLPQAPNLAILGLTLPITSQPNTPESPRRNQSSSSKGIFNNNHPAPIPINTTDPLKSTSYTESSNQQMPKSISSSEQHIAEQTQERTKRSSSYPLAHQEYTSLEILGVFKTPVQLTGRVIAIVKKFQNYFITAFSENNAAATAEHILDLKEGITLTVKITLPQSGTDNTWFRNGLIKLLTSFVYNALQKNCDISSDKDYSTLTMKDGTTLVMIRNATLSNPSNRMLPEAKI